jgi:hypothetical protein
MVLVGFVSGPRRPALIASGLAHGFFLFSCGTLFLTPHDLRWHVGTALDRLMLHSAILLTLSPFLLLAEKGPCH